MMINTVALIVAFVVVLAVAGYALWHRSHKPNGDHK